MIRDTIDYVAKARAAWGDDIPGWILVLAEQCNLTSQSKVGRVLGRSGSMISQLISNTYGARDLSAIRERVEGMFMSQTVICPVQGQMPVHVCRDWRIKARDFSNINDLHVRMFRACTRCPVNAEEDR